MVSLVLLDNSNKRILQSAMVSHSRQLAQGSTILKITNISYDIPSKLLNLIFIYNKTIDLSTQSLQFVSSGSTNSPYSRYFYSTPPVQIML